MIKNIMFAKGIYINRTLVTEIDVSFHAWVDKTVITREKDCFKIEFKSPKQNIDVETVFVPVYNVLYFKLIDVK